MKHIYIQAIPWNIVVAKFIIGTGMGEECALTALYAHNVGKAGNASLHDLNERGINSGTLHRVDAKSATIIVTNSAESVNRHTRVEFFQIY